MGGKKKNMNEKKRWNKGGKKRGDKRTETTMIFLNTTQKETS